MLQRSVVCLVLLAVVGCSGGTRSYGVSIKNDLPRPVTIALTKDGPPFEAPWASPEDLAAGRVIRDDASGFRVVEAGRTASVNNINGRFDKGSKAILRVYSGSMTFREMLDTMPGSNRVDVTLTPGKNQLVVRESSQGIRVEPRQ
jgi:hypothetical protein